MEKYGQAAAVTKKVRLPPSFRAAFNAAVACPTALPQCFKK